METKDSKHTSVKQEMNEDHSYVLVHRGRTPTNSDLWSILVVKTNGEVFGSSQNSPIDGTMEEGGVAMGEFTRVDSLCGLNVRKLVAGPDFGLALTSDDTLYKWEVKNIPKEAIIMVQAYSNGPCHCGRIRGHSYKLCGFALLQCRHRKTSRFNIYSRSNPPPLGVNICQFIMYDRAQVSCPKCEKPCGKSVYLFDDSYINQCFTCNLFAEAGAIAKYITSVENLRKLDSGIIDVDAGDRFICSLSKDFKVKLQLNDETTRTVCQLPGADRVQSVSCGSNHIAVITTAGDLYSYGELDDEDIMKASIFKTISLMKLNVPVRGVKVCCWKASTACLLVDKSVYLFQNGIPSMLIAAPWFYGCSIKPIMEELYVRPVSEGSEVFPRIHGQDSRAFWSLLVSESRRSSFPPEYGKAPPQQITNLYTIQKTLYGCKSLSDLTLKLAGEDFPAHWVVLISTSQYFREIFRTGIIPSTLDMTSYNPRAYKCLLQHFYQITAEELPVSDLLDLLEIATSYEEKHIVEVIIQSLEGQIQAENVLKILSKARSLANLDLIEDCENFIRSANFKDHFAELCINDPSKFLGS